MTYANQSREKIVLQLLTINANVLVPTEMVVQEFWGSTEHHKPSTVYLAQVISKVRNTLPYGKIENVYGKGFIFRPIFYKRPLDVRRANGKR